MNAGRPERMSTSTRTWRGSTPSMAKVAMRESMARRYARTSNTWVTRGNDSAHAPARRVRRVEHTPSPTCHRTTRSVENDEQRSAPATRPPRRAARVRAPDQARVRDRRAQLPHPLGRARHHRHRRPGPGVLRGEDAASRPRRRRAAGRRPRSQALAGAQDGGPVAGGADRPALRRADPLRRHRRDVRLGGRRSSGSSTSRTRSERQPGVARPDRPARQLGAVRPDGPARPHGRRAQRGPNYSDSCW